MNLEKYKDYYIMTYTGKKFHIFNPKIEEIDLLDIIHSLSFNCRYNGHSSQFFSIAEHSILVSTMVPEKLKIYALLHDSAEAYVTDLPRPLKMALNEYTDNLIKNLENNILNLIYKSLDLSTLSKEDEHILKLADNTALYIEACHFFDEDKIKEWNFGEMLIPIPNIKLSHITKDPYQISIEYTKKLINYLKSNYTFKGD